MLHVLHGLFRRSPVLASVLSLCILTLAGIPPTVGFFAKFYIFQAAFESGYVGRVIIGLLTTILSACYYLRMIAVMFTEDLAERSVLRRSWPAAFVGIISCAAIVMLSSYPAPLIDLWSFRYR